LLDGVAVKVGVSGDELWLKPICTNSEECELYLGHVSTPILGKFHLTAEEFSMLSCTGTLIVGDRDGSVEITKISLDGIIYDSGFQGINIAAGRHLEAPADIIFEGAISTFAHDLQLHASGRITMNARFISDGFTTVINADELCVGYGIRIMQPVSTNSSSTMTLNGGDIMIR
jgi:hypothetical protein